LEYPIYTRWDTSRNPFDPLVDVTEACIEPGPAA
jgi:hypothetical protein